MHEEVTNRVLLGSTSHGCPEQAVRILGVSMGVGLRPKAKAMEPPPNPTDASWSSREVLFCGRSDLGGEQNRGPEHKGMTAPPKAEAVSKSQGMDKSLSADPNQRGEGRCLEGRNGYVHLKGCRGRGPSTRGKTCRDNVGKVPLSAGADSNLQRPAERGEKP